MSVTAESPVTDLSRIPGACERTLTRELPAGGTVFFEEAPVGWLTKDGKPRQRPHRAYYYAATIECNACGGSGRTPSEKRPGGTVKCQPCKGSGECPRSRLTAVSSVLDVVCPKPGLPPWAEARGIEGAVIAMRMGEIGPLLEPAEAVARVRGLGLGADRARDTAAERGVNVHGLLEEYMRTGNAPRLVDHPPEHAGYIQGLSRFLLKVNPEPISDDGTGVEELVASPADGYAGRRDLRARAGGLVIGWDAKTQEKAGIWRGAHLQTRLYERAAVRGGDDPCDLLKVVVFAANGEYREMACMADDATAETALAYWRACQPIDSACEAANTVERDARRRP